MSDNTALFDLIERLSRLCGTSGDEGDVRDFIRSRLPVGCEVTTDNLGNLTVFRKGAKTPKNKIMYCAHMDEVGFIVTDIAPDGRLKLAPVGGISPDVVFGRRIVLKSGRVGVIAAKPVHHLSDSEKDRQPKIEELSADIGAKDKEEAEKLVERGEYCYFDGAYEEFGEGFIKGKALDDRVGCAIMLTLLNGELTFDAWFVFTVQEEIGTRGAACAAYNVKPDIAVVLETTTACDIPGSKGEKSVCRLGEGVVVSFMDRSTIYDRELYRIGRETAGNAGVKHQTKTLVAGGNDSGAIHKAIGGIRTTALSVPTRYLHSPACVMKKEDVEATLTTAAALLNRLAEL